MFSSPLKRKKNSILFNADGVRYFPEKKRPRREANHSLPSSDLMAWTKINCLKFVVYEKQGDILHDSQDLSM
jgi:hypothetical protein